MIFYRISLLVTLFTVSSLTLVAQTSPIGSWRSYLPYKSSIGVATDGKTIFSISNQSFSVYNSLTEQLDAYTKVEGISDIGMQCLAYDATTGRTILVYNNGNIDIFKDNTFYNLPELKIKTIAGDKTVYSVYTLNGYAYLSSTLGIIVVDMEKVSVKETYEFIINKRTVPVKGVVARGDSLYAIAGKGIYRANINSNELQNFQIWENVDTSYTYSAICLMNNEVYVSTKNSVFRISDTGMVSTYTTGRSIIHLDASDSNLYISEYNDTSFNGFVSILNTSGTIADSIVMNSMRPRQVVQTFDKRYWIAEEFAGLLRFNEKREFGYYTPSGPLNANSFDIYANNSNLWVAHGGYTDKYLSANNPSGVGKYTDDIWKYYTRGVFRPFDTLSDFSFITRDEANGTTYMGSFRFGVYELKADGTGALYNRNVIYDPSASVGSGFTQIVGLALDSKKNLWSSTMFTFNQLYVKTPENEWYKFKVPGSLYGGNLVIDDNDQIWMVCNEGGGLSVYNTNGTIADRSDDATYHLSTGKTFGNLPSNTVNCLAKDKNNNIWVGTANGIGIVNNCTPPFTQQAPCDAEIPVVQYDQYAGFLFAGNNVRTIAVDGANRKWVGTDDGIWLLSPDAGSIIYRFTVDNSPLPSNRIQKISIDGITGEVYIGTEQGLMSFRSTATEGGTKNEDVLVFPNPVPSGYSGIIAINGLVANADVRITDINGQLIYRTKALGGQAVWNGLDYKGQRPQSGVYLIFSSDTQGEETHTGKVVFLK